VYKRQAGTADGAGLHPRRYIAEDDLDDEVHSVGLAWSGTPATAARTGGKTDRIAADLRRDVVDPITGLALLNRLARTAAGPCGRSLDIYDGRRRYVLKIGAGRPRTVDGAWSDSWSGEGIACTFDFGRIEGFEKATQVLDKLRSGILIFGALDGGPTALVRIESDARWSSARILLVAWCRSTAPSLETRPAPEAVRAFACPRDD